MGFLTGAKGSIDSQIRRANDLRQRRGFLLLRGLRLDPELLSSGARRLAAASRAGTSDPVLRQDHDAQSAASRPLKVLMCPGDEFYGPPQRRLVTFSLLELAALKLDCKRTYE